MGITFNNIPGVGARATWPAIGTEAAELVHKAYQNYRYNEIAWARDRANKVYIRYNPAGSAGGGGGAGTFVSPYLVRHLADLKTLVAGLPRTANTALIFFDDDVIGGFAANTDQSCVIDWSSVSVGRTNTGFRRPEITGFIPITGGPTAGSQVGSSTAIVGSVATVDVSGTPGLLIYWVRGRLPGSTSRDDFDLQPYVIAKDVADCTATAYSFFSDATHLVINFGAHDPTLVEVTTNTAPGLWFKNVGDVACDDVIVEGFGMDQVFAAGGGMCVRFEGNGTNTFVSRNGKYLWGPYHTSAHIVAAAGGAGGISTWHNCEFGYHMWDSGGGGDGNVCYNGDGGHEYGRYNCTQIRGGLDMTPAYFALAAHVTMSANANSITNPRGFSYGTPYGHTTTGTVSYYFEADCTYVAQTGQTIVNDHMCGNVPAVADKDAQTSYVGGSRNRTVTCLAIAPDAMWGDHESMRTTVYVARPESGAFVYLFGAGALKGQFRNWDLEANILAGVWAGKSVRLFVSGTHDFRWIHGRRRFTGVNCNGIATMWATGLQTCTIYNGVESLENGIGAANYNFTEAPGGNHFPEQSLSAGGVIGLAQWTIQATQVDGLTGVVGLAAAANWTNGPGTPANIRNVSQALPANVNCWRDLLGNRRNPNQALRTLGPIEANPFSLGNWRSRQYRGRLCWRPN